MNLLNETNSLCMKGVTNQEVGDTKCFGNKSDFFSDTRKKNIIQISWKSRSYIVLRKMCKNLEVIRVAHYRLRNFARYGHIKKTRNNEAFCIFI